MKWGKLINIELRVVHFRKPPPEPLVESWKLNKSGRTKKGKQIGFGGYFRQAIYVSQQDERDAGLVKIFMDLLSVVRIEFHCVSEKGIVEKRWKVVSYLAHTCFYYTKRIVHRSSPTRISVDWTYHWSIRSWTKTDCMELIMGNGLDIARWGRRVSMAGGHVLSREGLKHRKRLSPICAKRRMEAGPTSADCWIVGWRGYRGANSRERAWETRLHVDRRGGAAFSRARSPPT